MHPASLRIADFTYTLPEDRIARYPLAERDSSKLLVYKDGIIAEDVYAHISNYVPALSLLVFNQTKVVNARLQFRKDTGAKIEVFCLEPDDRYSDVQAAMLQQGDVFWKCMIGGAAKWKEGQIIQAGNGDNAESLRIYAAMSGKRDGYYILRLYWEPAHLSFAEVLQQAGKVPLPPYLNREAEESDQYRYQTIFAREEGSVAAPTAALHFTERILATLKEKGINSGRVTLHVGAGTFKPVKSERMQDHDMHAEWIDVDHTFLLQLIEQVKQSRTVIAVGTTSARTLESLYWIGAQLAAGGQPDFEGIAVQQWLPYEEEHSTGVLAALQALEQYMTAQDTKRLVTRTRIIIAPGYRFRVISALVTNFHQPQSTLLLLVAALIGPAWRKVYDYALQEQYRFLSYGDGCLLWDLSAGKLRETSCQ